MKLNATWQKFTVEGIVIVASILVAFAIDAWWNSRLDLALEKDLYALLNAGFIENIRHIETEFTRGLEDGELLEQFVDMTPAEAKLIPESKTWEYFRALWRPRISELNSAELIATVDAARLSIETSHPLLATIAEWRESVTRLASLNEILSNLEQDVIHKFALHQELQPIFARSSSNRSEGVLVPGYVAGRIREDNQIMSLAARKAQTTNIQLLFLEEVKLRATAVIESLRLVQQ